VEWVLAGVQAQIPDTEIAEGAKMEEAAIATGRDHQDTEILRPDMVVEVVAANLQDNLAMIAEVAGAAAAMKVVAAAAAVILMMIMEEVNLQDALMTIILEEVNLQDALMMIIIAPEEVEGVEVPDWAEVEAQVPQAGVAETGGIGNFFSKHY